MSARTRDDLPGDLGDLAREIVDSISAWSKADFIRDRTKQRSLERTLELLGEVATRLGDEAPDVDIDWRALRRLMVRLAHAYHDMDAERLWAYADNEVRRLDEAVQPLLAYSWKPSLKLRGV